MELENRISELRKEKNITQVRLSVELEVTQETISSYENGRHLPSVPSLIKLSGIFDASIDYILKRTDVRKYTKREVLSNDEINILNTYNQLNDRNKIRTYSYMLGLSDSVR